MLEQWPCGCPALAFYDFNARSLQVEATNVFGTLKLRRVAM
jgi:hypothetical protein